MSKALYIISLIKTGRPDGLFSAKELSQLTNAPVDYVRELARSRCLPLANEYDFSDPNVLHAKRYWPYLNKITNYRELTKEQWLEELKNAQDELTY